MPLLWRLSPGSAHCNKTLRLFSVRVLDFSGETCKCESLLLLAIWSAKCIGHHHFVCCKTKRHKGNPFATIVEKQSASKIEVWKEQQFELASCSAGAGWIEHITAHQGFYGNRLGLPK